MEHGCLGCPYRAQCEAGEIVWACEEVDLDLDEE